MKNIATKAIAMLTALVMLLCCVPAMPVHAASSYPNTHVNTGNMAADLVSVALTQAGYCEGSLTGNPANASSNNYQKYGQWYDQNVDNIGVTRAAWCAAFVSWCANQAGIPSSIVYYHAYCPYGVNWFRNQGRFQYAASRGGSYVPKAGDIVYFAPAGSSTSSHIGIVRYAKNGYVYTVEGNTSGQNGEVNEGGGVFLKSYSLSYSRLYGYGIPNYQDNSGHTITFDSNGGSAVASVSVKDGSTLSAPANPTRYGFNFAGWYCNPELTDPYDFSSPVPYSFTLYAKWEEAYWGANTNLMPVDGLVVREDYQNTDQYVWPYYNDDGSVTIYNGVTNDANHSWPSMYMGYENSVDSGNDAYIYVKYNATAQFNATIDYLDADGNPQSVKLSQLAGQGDNDLPAGYNEFFVNFGQYVYDQGHLTTSDGSVHSRNVKYTKVTYYVVGGLDEYVRLYDMKFTPAFDIAPAYTNLMTNNITQDGGYGSYVYDNGVLTVNASTDAGYTVTLHPNASFDPSDMQYLLANINSDVPFNVSMELTRADGDASMQWRSEFYPLFGLAETPTALPAGSWELPMDLNGYFHWNGGTVTQTTVKSVTISLTGKGTLTMDKLQAHKGIVGKPVADGLYAEDSIWAPIGSMLPVSGQLVYDDFQGTGESVWDYYNDDGSVTLYNTVDAVEYSWPSGHMNYKNVVDLNATPNLHLNFRCDAGFNCEITYLGDNGESHTVNLSTIAGIDTTDFEAGTHDLYLDFASYLESQGHTPASGKLKISKVTYYVVGTKDSYARLYDLAFTADSGVTEPEPTPAISLKYPTLSFEGEVFYNVYFTTENLDVDVADMGLLTWYNRPADTASATYESAEFVIPGAAAGSGEYMVHTQGIPAKNLGDNLYLRIYAKLSDGSYVYSPVTYYNAKFYASDILANSQNVNMKSLVVAMLNYGAAAQIHFGHNVGSLMNADLTDAQKALAKDYSADMISSLVTPDTSKTANFKSNGGFSGGYPSVSFEGAFAINYYLTPKQTVEGNITLYCWDLATYNSVTELTEENATAKVTMVPATNPAEYFANYSGIAAKQIDETVFVAGIYTSGGVRYSSPIISYSLGAYCAEQIANGSATMQDFAKATVVYGDAAKTYFSALS